MDFELSPEQSEIQATARAFADEVVAPQAARADLRSEFPLAVVRQMGDLGFFGLPFPEALGGVGAGFLAYLLALEEVSRADAAVGITLEAGCSLGIAPIASFGTAEQQGRLLPDLMAGRALWAFGLTEPEAGSDAGGTRTRATREAGGWVLDGEKCFITNAGTEMSRGVTLTARTDPRGAAADGPAAPPRPRISAFLVERGTPGYLVGPPYRKLGWHASDTRPLTLDGCRVPDRNLLGTEGGGFRQFLTVLEGGRVAIASLSVGVAQACLDAALAHARARRQFGRPIARFQAIQTKLADMATQIELARLMVWRAGSLIEAGRPAGRFAAMAKLHASEVATACANQAVQIHGGSGFMEDLPVARYYRDVKINEIGEGTSEVQRLVIASHLLGHGGRVSPLLADGGEAGEQG
ncbi:MAG TPA: acyl-CoA dehydrogenase family protein [Candidatus Micrarchaeia archaeon]|nr:acyl-CoA dehydrogenase family protein [Candidatus Micrarchaeia archaeon]